MALLAFGDFVLDTAEKRVLRGEQPIDLVGMPLALLSYFVEHAADGRVVTKNELRARVWDCHVEDVTIRSSLSSLRDALGDSVRSPRYLQTHGKEGWRLLVPVQRQFDSANKARPPAPGGAYDPACYVPRPSEEHVLLSCLQTPGRPAVVFGPPGSGKRTLIERTLERAASHHESPPLGRIVRTSVRPATGETSLDPFLKELGRLLLEASGKTEEDAQKILEGVWSRPILAKQRFRELVLQHILVSRSPGPSVALVFCDVDRVAACPYQEDFFNMLRGWQDDRFLAPVRLVLETLIPPRLFPLGSQSPLWTKVQRIDVSFITDKQLAQLAELHGLEPSAPACARLGELVGWNFLLARVALFHAAVNGLLLDAVLTGCKPAVRAFGGFTDHLEDLSHSLDRLDASGASAQPIGTLLHEATKGVSLPLQTAWSLLQKGVLAETETRNRYRLRCPLYADFFGSPQP